MSTPPTFSNGTALDASSLNKVGMWLVSKTTVPAGQTAVTVANCFSADFDAYRVTWTGGTCSAALADMEITLNNASAGTYYSYLMYHSTGAPATLLGGSFPGGNKFYWLGGGDPNFAVLDVVLYNPYLALPTLVTSLTYNATNGYGMTHGKQNQAVSHTGMSLVIDTGTFSNGTLCVYGLTK